MYFFSNVNILIICLMLVVMIIHDLIFDFKDIGKYHL